MLSVAGDTEMSEVSLLSRAHGLMEKIKRYTTNSNVMWYGKCYTRRIIKYYVSTDGMINSVGEEGQAILWMCIEMLFLKASNPHYYQMIIFDSWHKPISENCGIVWEQNTNNFNIYKKFLNQQKKQIYKKYQYPKVHCKLLFTWLYFYIHSCDLI